LGEKKRGQLNGRAAEAEELFQFQFVVLQACGVLKSSRDAKVVSTSIFSWR
jgi:hypothetical protein